MTDRLEVNIQDLPDECKHTILTMEKLGHLKYLRYLLSKRYPPLPLIMELKKLGLSSPQEDMLIVYFNNVIWPAVEKFGLKGFYGEYKANINNKKKIRTNKSVLNFRIDVAPNVDSQVNFLKFIFYLDVDNLWMSEVKRYYGSSSNFPVDENGDRLLVSSFGSATATSYTFEKIVQHPKRYMIDKMILEDVPDTRISEWVKRELNMSLSVADITLYRISFFNIRAFSIEEKIKMLEKEQKYFEQTLKDLDRENASLPEQMTSGEKLGLIRAAELRIAEIKDNILTLNSRYNNTVNGILNQDSEDVVTMVETMIRKTYDKFSEVSQTHDPSAISPMYTLTRSFCLLTDKLETVKNQSASNPERNHTDAGADAAILQLYKQKIEDMNGADGYMFDENEGVSPSDISGIEELNVAYKDDDDEDIEMDDGEDYGE